MSLARTTAATPDLRRTELAIARRFLYVGGMSIFLEYAHADSSRAGRAFPERILSLQSHIVHLLRAEPMRDGAPHHFDADDFLFRQA